jgi:hypothetical protein
MLDDRKCTGYYTDPGNRLSLTVANYLILGVNSGVAMFAT